MATVKKYLDYAGLGAYDTAIKAWANSANQLGYKSFVVNDGKLYLFPKQNATTSDIVASGDNATPYVDISGSDISTTLDALAAVIGATYANGAYSLTLTGFGNDVDTAVEALNELRAELTTDTSDITTLKGADSVAGSVANSIKTAIEALDKSEFAIAEKDGSTNVITIHGVKEVDGIIDKGSTSVDLELAAVAATGAAEDVSYEATIGSSSVTNVDDALDALVTLAGEGAASKTISMTSPSASGTDYAAIYNIYQGANTYIADRTDGKTNPTLIGTINIPKDQFVESAELVNVTFDETNVALKDGATDVTSLIVNGTPTAADAGKYIKLVFAITSGSQAKSTVYVSVKSLVDVYSGNVGAEITVSVDANSNVISASVNKISGTKIVYKAAVMDGDTVVTPEETVVDALNNIGSIPLTGTDSVASLF